MGIREPIKRVLKMCGHAMVSTVHERLDAMERQIAELADTQTSLLRAAIDTAEKQAAQAETIQKAEREAPEAALMAFLYSFLPERTAIDVGANVGDISECLLGAGFEVYAFEPNPPVYRKLAERFREEKRFRAFQYAVGSENGERALHLVENRTQHLGGNGAKYQEQTLYSSLEPHPMPEGLVFTGTVKVTLKRLADLHDSGALPKNVGLVKIDTEGFDLEVIRGMGDYRYPVVVAEYWGLDTPFGARYTLDRLVREMRERGYAWNIVMYRAWIGLDRGFYSNSAEAMPNSCGNVFFFRDHGVFREAQAWCEAELERKNPRRPVTVTGESLSRAPVPATAPADLDAIVAHIEVNDHHGVGVLLQRLFGEYPNIASIRSQNFYEGRQDFGQLHACIADGAESGLREALAGRRVKRILAVPYFAQDVRNALALRGMSKAPLCTYLMDDQNLCADGIPDALMKELLEKSDVRLAISPQLAAGYQKKYGQDMWFLPPLAPHRFLLEYLDRVPETHGKPGVMVGNIWGARWVELLRETVRDSGIELRWYNHGEFRWLGCEPEALIADGIHPLTGVDTADEALIEILRSAPFVVLPSGTLDEFDDRRFIAQLSLPSRIPYIFATSQAPILVLGSAETAAAQFVVRHGIGMVAPYRREEFQSAVEKITRAEVNLEMRRSAFALAARFSDLGAAEWIWRSLEKGRAADLRFEDLRF